MDSAPALAPGIPVDYYRSIFDVEQHHWWHLGMRELSRVLLGERLTREGAAILDAGCGTGGFLRWAIDCGSFDLVAGLDVAGSAIELAGRRVPEADLRTGRLTSLPFDDGVFDIVVTNDVLQHVPEAELDASMAELRRVVAPDGVLLVRTNGARRQRREREDWCVFDREALVGLLGRAGFACERATHANVLGSAIATAAGRTPRAPNEQKHGVPNDPGRARSAIGRKALAWEARYLAGPNRSLPYGHTLFAVGRPV